MEVIFPRQRPWIRRTEADSSRSPGQDFAVPPPRRVVHFPLGMGKISQGSEGIGQAGVLIPFNPVEK